MDFGAQDWTDWIRGLIHIQVTESSFLQTANGYFAHRVHRVRFRILPSGRLARAPMEATDS